VRHGYQLGVKDIFFYQLVTDLVKVMGDAYPELKEKQQFVERVLQEEEQQFARTLENGMVILEKAIAELDEKVLPGETVFKLYDTYGFPVDLTADVARENDLSIDMDGFDQAMSVQKDQARSASNFSAVSKLEIEIEQDGTEFIGYEHLEGSASVLAVYLDNKTVNEISGETDALLVLDNSPFYGESGGQVGDTGVLENDATSFAVSDTQKQGDYLIHSGTLQKGVLKVGDSLATKVSSEDRVAITLNHSATHLMHAALRNILGDHVTQKGSLVNAEHLRFDFSHPVQVTRDELGAIESAVNQQVLNNTDVSKQAMSIDEAKERGALALFGEKYGDEVRVVSMGDAFSTELCGGTHIDRTGNIGLFKIISESGIAAGIRRIEAVAGNRALEYVIREEQTLKEICDVVKTSSDGLVDKVKQLATQNRTLEKQLEQMKAKMASSAGTDLVSQAEEVNGIKLLATAVEGFNPKALRDTVDQLKNKLGSSVIVLASSSGDKVNLVAGVSKDLTAKVKAGELVNMIAEQVGGKGGGRPDMAMAGGNDPGGVPAAIGSVKAWVEERL